jgi:hypothetical protein
MGSSKEVLINGVRSTRNYFSKTCQYIYLGHSPARRSVFVLIDRLLTIRFRNADATHELVKCPMFSKFEAFGLRSFSTGTPVPVSSMCVLWSSIRKPEATGMELYRTLTEHTVPWILHGYRRRPKASKTQNRNMELYRTLTET